MSNLGTKVQLYLEANGKDFATEFYAKKVEVKEEKTVDIDTSGPDVDIKLPDEKTPEEVEVKEEAKEE